MNKPVLVLILVALARPALARVIEVDSTGSIAKAVAKAGPGDTVLIKGGTYREKEIRILKSGTADKPLTIAGEPGTTVTLKGSVVVTNWLAAGNGVWKSTNWIVNSQQLFCDGRPLQQIGVQSPWHKNKVNDNQVSLPPVGKNTADLVPGSFYYDAPAKELLCLLPDRADPRGHLMEASVYDAILVSDDQSFVVIRNLNFQHSNGTARGQWAALLRVSGTNWLIEDCTFRDGDFAGLTLAGEGHIVRRCRLLNNGDEGLGMNGSDEAHGYKWYRDRPPQNILFEDLVVTGNNYRRFYEHWHAGGMKLIPAIRAVTVRRCRVEDNWGPGIWFDGTLGDNVIEDNLVARNRTGIFYEVSMPATGDKFGALIRSNRVISSANQGIYISASSGAIVEGNTCYSNHWDIVLHGMPRNDFGFAMPLAQNVVRSNSVAGLDADIIVFMGAGSSNNVVDANIYPARVRFSATTNDYDVTHHDLDALRRDTGFEMHGTTRQP